MAFDLCEHNIRQIIIKCGKLLYPDENDVTVLYQKTCVLLGRRTDLVSSSSVNHLPSPEESAKADPLNKLTTICPKCGKRSYVIYGLCKSCKDAENGIYKTMFKCYECQYQVKSKEPIVIWMQRLGIEFGTQSKESLGVRTITDEGVK